MLIALGLLCALAPSVILVLILWMRRRNKATGT
jgi:hypothetical protein